MNNVFFFQTQQIPDSSSIFNQLKEQKIFFSYFQVDQKYYIFIYSQKSIDINFLYQLIDVIQELDSKQRKIRSFRGFFLYGLEIMQMGENYEILKTNLQPFFWRKVKTIIRQNQKGALLEFLFGKDEVNQEQTDLCSAGLIPHMQDQIQILKNEMSSLQQKIIELEQNQTLTIKKTLNELLKRSQASKIDQQADYTFKSEDSPQSTDLLENDSEVNLEVQEPRSEISKTVSEAKIKPVTQLSNNQQYNISSNQEKGLDEPDFRSLPEDEQKEIIKTGFQLQAEGKISFKKYYESTDPYSLFQWKRYSFKYETVRKYKLYKDLKKDFKEQLKDN